MNVLLRILLVGMLLMTLRATASNAVTGNAASVVVDISTTGAQPGDMVLLLAGASASGAKIFPGGFVALGTQIVAATQNGSGYWDLQYCVLPDPVPASLTISGPNTHWVGVARIYSGRRGLTPNYAQTPVVAYAAQPVTASLTGLRANEGDDLDLFIVSGQVVTGGTCNWTPPPGTTNTLIDYNNNDTNYIAVSWLGELASSPPQLSATLNAWAGQSIGYGAWVVALAKQPDDQLFQYIGSGALASGANPSPALPANWQPGDLLVVEAASAANSAFGSTPAGWNNPITGGSSGQCGMKLYWKQAAVGETAPALSNASAASVAQMVAYRGIDTSNYDAVSGVTGVGNGMSGCNANSVNTAADYDLVIRIWGAVVSGNQITWTLPPNVIQRIIGGGLSPLAAIYLCDQTVAPYGATGIVSAVENRNLGVEGATIAFKQVKPTYAGDSCAQARVLRVA